MLHKAQHLAPEMAGVRLNIGLVYYRQNDFRKAIPPFESVVHDAPDSFQARYLLGLCYFFVERYGEAASTLQPLWSQPEAKPGRFEDGLDAAKNRFAGILTDLDLDTPKELAQ